MRKLPWAAGLGAAAVIATSAWAQGSGVVKRPQMPGSTTYPVTEFIGRRSPGTLRASDFVGRTVYGAEGQVIGEVSDVLFGADGRMSGLVLEVGGTLGFGERKVAVPIHAFRIDPGTTATTGTAGGLPASTASGVDTRQDNRISNIVYPDRIILPVPLDQIRSAPPFEDNMRTAKPAAAPRK